MEAESVKQIAQMAVPEIQKISQELLAWVQSVRELAGEQAPLLAQEIIRFGIYQSIFNILFDIIWILSSIILIPYLGRRVNLENEPAIDISIGVMLVGSAVCFIALFFNIISLGQAILAPRLYLLEFLARLVK